MPRRDQVMLSSELAEMGAHDARLAAQRGAMRRLGHHTKHEDI